MTNTIPLRLTRRHKSSTSSSWARDRSGRPGAVGEQRKGELFDRVWSRNPVRRLRTAEEIAHGVLFALTNTFITAVSLPIDGGEPLV